MANVECPHKIYFVSWLDAWATTRTYNPEADNKPLLSWNVGFLAEDNEDYILLCSNAAENETLSDVFCVPRDMIVKIEELV